MTSVERTLRKRFQPTWSMHRLIVDWGCDVASSDIRDIDFEEGSGHGGTLRLFHLERVPGDPAKYEVRAIAFSGYYNTGTTFAQTQIDGKKLEGSLLAVRMAMLAKMHDISTYRDGGGLGGVGFGMSSNDFHLRIRLADKVGNAIDRGFSGYQSSMDQEDRLPVELAAEPLQAALKPVPFSPGVPTQADRELFVRHFVATFEKEPFWWVGERMFELAPELGTAEIVPSIIEWLARGDPKGAGNERIRGEAVRALVAITGLDLRKTEAGGDRPLEEVIADYVRECG